MKRVLLTGATGFLGSYVARLLVAQNYQVIAIHRATSKFDLVAQVRDEIEWIECDLENLISHEEIFARIDIVIHCAALISFQPEDRARMYKTNVEATRDLVNLSLDNDIERFIHVSSIAALGRHKNDEVLNEQVEWQDGPLNTSYGISKQMAEREVWRGSAEGLDILILNPSLIIGAGYWAEGSPALLAKVHKGLSFYPTGTTGFVDVRDVAAFCVLAITSSKSGFRFIVSAQDMSYQDFFSKLSIAFGKKTPRIPLTKTLISIAWRLDFILAKILRKKRLLSKETLEAASRNGFYDNSLSQSSFKFDYRDIETSLIEMRSVYENSQNLSSKYGILPL